LTPRHAAVPSRPRAPAGPGRGGRTAVRPVGGVVVARPCRGPLPRPGAPGSQHPLAHGGTAALGGGRMPEAVGLGRGAGKMSFATPKATEPTPAELRAVGLALCRPDPGSKSPTYAGWSTRSQEPGDFGPSDLCGIIGGPLSDCNRPGHALVIIDLD